MCQHENFHDLNLWDFIDPDQCISNRLSNFLLGPCQCFSLSYFADVDGIHRRSVIIIATWAFYYSDFADAKNKCMGCNFSCEFLVGMPSSFFFVFIFVLEKKIQFNRSMETKLNVPYTTDSIQKEETRKQLVPKSKKISKAFRVC
jgi:hypothetical protein